MKSADIAKLNRRTMLLLFEFVKPFNFQLLTLYLPSDVVKGILLYAVEKNFKMEMGAC